ncbi:HIG1 domain-containing protein [Aphelenchoides besseyi]|nr:HIG1 domain-containing protein [Aphelenchoides besseyi]KAI6210429.1 HIG1 domain-containing protein [Aphelenchoides besseyi]
MIRSSISFSRVGIRRFVATQQPPPDTKNEQSWSTKKEFNAMHDELRSREKVDANSGIKPTSLQRRLLVFTGLYKQNMVPDYVPPATMRSLSQRIRALMVILITLTGTSLLLTYDIKLRKIPQKIAQDRAEGKNV